MTGPLFDVDEIYVGCPAFDQILAYRDRDFNVLATVERTFTDDSKIDALLAGDGIRHIDEHWVVCQDDQPVFSVERYLPAELPSYAVIDPTGTPLGAFVCSGGLIRRDVVVREGGSAPVAVIHVAHHRHVITETDGDEVGWCWRAFSGVGCGHRFGACRCVAALRDTRRVATLGPPLRHRVRRGRHWGARRQSDAVRRISADVGTATSCPVAVRPLSAGTACGRAGALACVEPAVALM